MDVVLKDVSQDAAERGKGHSATLLAKAVARGRSTQDKAEATLARITPTVDPADFAGCDLVVEAVYESVELKQAVLQEVEGVVAPGTVLGSNTSTLPITGLAQGVQRPEDLIGLHFFSPVDKMPLLEIIVGDQTSDRTLAKAFDIARQIRKTPVVVNDSRGFFTSRVIGTFLNEAIAMVGEGVHPAVGGAGRTAGRLPGSPAPAGRRAQPDADEQDPQGDPGRPRGGGVPTAVPPPPGIRRHRPDGRGARAHRKARRRRVLRLRRRPADRAVAGAARAVRRRATVLPFEDMMERMLFAEALETVRCLDEGVLRSVEDANIGSILGIGFPGWTGGVVQYMNGYAGGLAGFAARAQVLADRYGAQFSPPASLVAKAQDGVTLTERSSVRVMAASPVRMVLPVRNLNWSFRLRGGRQDDPCIRDSPTRHTRQVPG